jgi:uncharacterized protein
MNDSMLQIVKKNARHLLNDSNGSHDWGHTLRVYRLCERIGPAEDADLSVLLSAAYLHDIGRRYQDISNGIFCHAEKGAEIATGIISELSFSNDEKENIIHCIKTHRFRGKNVPETIEAKVLFDADKIDAIGAVGVARAYLFAGELGAKLHNSQKSIEDTKAYTKEDTGYREYKVKLCKIKDRILTKTGMEIAGDRHEFMENFFKRFLEEHEGVK